MAAMSHDIPPAASNTQPCQIATKISNNVPPIYTLPSECMDHVASKLDLPDLMRLRSTSRRLEQQSLYRFAHRKFYRITLGRSSSKDSITFKRLRLAPFPSAVRSLNMELQLDSGASRPQSSLASMLGHLSCLKSIKIYGVWGRNSVWQKTAPVDAIFQGVLASGARLDNLHFNNCSADAVALASMLKLLGPSLKKLHLSYVWLQGNGIDDLLSAPLGLSLEELYFSDVSVIAETRLRSAAASGRRLFPAPPVTSDMFGDSLNSVYPCRKQYYRISGHVVSAFGELATKAAVAKMIELRERT